jgi:hypothetical protein
MTSVAVNAVSNTIVVSENGSSTVVTVPVVQTITAITEGPQGPSGVAAGALPVGGSPGNILLKQTNANYDADWVATLDGGTFN